METEELSENPGKMENEEDSEDSGKMENEEDSEDSGKGENEEVLETHRLPALKNLYMDNTLDSPTRNRFAQLWRDRSDSDFTIVVNGKPKEVHEEVLSTNNYFRGMFNSRMKENVSRSVEVNSDEITEVGTDAFLRYMYTRCILLSRDNFEDVCFVARYFWDDQLMSHCVDNARRSLNFDNAYQFWNFAIHENLPSIEDRVVMFVCENFEKFLDSPAFVKVPLEFVSLFLSRNDITLNEEMNLVKASCKWASSKAEERSCHIPTLFGKLRAGFLRTIPTRSTELYYMTKEMNDSYSELLKGFKETTDEEIRAAHFIPRNYRTGLFFLGEEEIVRYCPREDCVHKVASYEKVNPEARFFDTNGTLRLNAGYGDPDENLKHYFNFATRTWEPFTSEERLTPETDTGSLALAVDQRQRPRPPYCYRLPYRSRTQQFSDEVMKDGRGFFFHYYSHQEQKSQLFYIGMHHGDEVYLEARVDQQRVLRMPNFSVRRPFLLYRKKRVQVFQQEDYLIFITFDKTKAHSHRLIKINLEKLLEKLESVDNFSFSSLVEKSFVKTTFLPRDFAAVT